MNIKQKARHRITPNGSEAKKIKWQDPGQKLLIRQAPQINLRLMCWHLNGVKNSFDGRIVKSRLCWCEEKLHCTLIDELISFRNRLKSPGVSFKRDVLGLPHSISYQVCLGSEEDPVSKLCFHGGARDCVNNERPQEKGTCTVLRQTEK